MIVDPELVHVEIEVPFGNVIGLAFQANPELLKPPVAADQPSQDDDGRAQVRHMGSDPPNDALGRIERRLLRLILCQNPIPFLQQQLDHSLCNTLFFRGDWNFHRVLHVLDEREGDVHLVLPHRAPDRRKALIKARQRIDAEEGQKAREPPGMIHIGKAEAKEPLIGSLPVLLHIHLGALILLDHGADRGRHRQHDEQEHGQLDGGEELDQFSPDLVPAEAR